MWENEWWESYAQRLLHPDTLYDGVHMQTTLENAFIRGMGEGCLQLTVLGMTQKGVFAKDVEYIKEAIADLMKHQTDEPIRRALLPDA